MYTVKKLSELAGVSVRTLHYYDDIGLLKPSLVGENSYRYYDDASLLRLQQILFYREIGLELRGIKEILDDPDFDTVTALQLHRRTLQEKIERLQTLIQTVDTTIMHLIGEIDMSNKKTIFEGFSEEKQKQYEKEAVDHWGDNASQSIKLWHSYSDERKAQIMQEGGDIYVEIVANMGKGADSPEIRALLVRWHQHLRYFYEPTIEVLGGLGNMYHDHPDFNATFTRIHPDLPVFLKEAIAIYVDELETRWLERELGILEE
ncbi:MAG: MerR family transcriptional regulator [Anaerolineae bacterium]|nr:MerR family transcriptional regulator [Anaerolineae bacterium]